MRQFMIKCVAVALSLVFVLVLAEALLRIAPSLIGLAVLDRFHPDLRSQIAKEIGLETGDDFILVTSAERSDKGPEFYLMKPNGVYRKPVDDVDKLYGAVEVVTTDERGFCNPPETTGLKTVDVVTLAGSIPTCSYVEGKDVFSAYLGRETSLRSYNLAVRGVGPYEYLEVLKRYIGELKPRIVIFALGEGNDLRDCLRYLDHISGRRIRERTPFGGPFALSYALAFIKGGIEVTIGMVKDSFRPNFRYSVVARQGTVEMNVANQDTDEVRLATAVLEGKAGPELYRAPLVEFVRMSREFDFVPLVTIAPNAYTIYDKDIVFQDLNVATPIRKLSNVQRQWLAASAQDIGYEFFDPTSYLQEHAAVRDLQYFPSNVHPTAEGQKMLAEALAAKVTELFRNEPAQRSDIEPN